MDERKEVWQGTGSGRLPGNYCKRKQMLMPPGRHRPFPFLVSLLSTLDRKNKLESIPHHYLPLKKLDPCRGLRVAGEVLLLSLSVAMDSATHRHVGYTVYRYPRHTGLIHTPLYCQVTNWTLIRYPTSDPFLDY
ncbi:hypothetical protein J6590_002493 [Homalodisca vitripennis]|nr:hypothetical protein J6590_002493 [Homalodisca vitripennis]